MLFEDRAFLTAELVARRSGISPRSVRRLARAGRIPSHRFPKGTLVFPDDTAERIHALPDFRRAYALPPTATTQVDDRQPPLEPESAA